MLIKSGLHGLLHTCPWTRKIIQQGFLTLALLTLWGQILIVVRGCPVHYRMFSSISSLYSLNVGRIPPPPSCDNTKYHQTLPNVNLRAKSPIVENQLLRTSFLIESLWATFTIQIFFK